MIVENQPPKINLIDNLTKLHLRSENWFFIYFFAQITIKHEKYYANYSFSKRGIRKIQFCHDFVAYFTVFAKYKKTRILLRKTQLKFYAKYISLEKLLRKIQCLFFRKIHSSSKTVPQNTVKFSAFGLRKIQTFPKIQ